MGIESEAIWFDGEMVPFHEAKVHVLTHTLHYGVGAFEGIRAYEQPHGGAGIWRLEDHIDRLIASLKMSRMPCPYDKATLMQACQQVLAVNKLPSAYIRPLAFFGMGKMGLGARDNPVHVIVAAWPWGAYMGDDGVQNGVRIKVSTFVRQHPNAALQRAKLVGHYVNSILARYEAEDDGYDEAIMLDHHGYVAEGTGENLFLIKNNEIMTPPSLNILPGITRASVMKILEHEGFHTDEQFFARDAFYVSDEAFMVGTAAEITPVREVDRRTVGNGKPGPITKRVQQLYADGVRGKIDWLQHYITDVQW